MNIIKVLWCRFHQCFGTFTILLVYHIKYPLKWDFLDIYLTMFSESVTSKKQNLWGSSFHSKCLKCNLSFKDAAKYWEKKKIFWDNCIWIDILKLSPLRTGCFSSVANVLTSSPTIWHVNKRDFFEHTFLSSDRWTWSILWCRFQQCLGTFTILLVEASSETGLFRDLSD